MLKKLMLMVLFGLWTVSLTTPVDAGGFISGRDGKILTHQFNWYIAVYKLKDSQKEKIYEEVLEVPVIQEDGSYLSSSDKIKVLEQRTKDNTNLITLRLKDIDVDGKSYSETFTFEDKGQFFYGKENEAGNMRVSMTRVVKTVNNPITLY